MACGKCGKKSGCVCANGGAGGGGNGAGSVTQLNAQINALTTQLNTIITAIQPFVTGHPIIMLQNTADITSFNSATGLGINTWLGWAICNGSTYINTLVTPNTTLVSPNLLDKFIVGAGGTYIVGNTGGAATVSLIASQNGTHSHVITDPGHVHVINDPGHLHNVTDPGHVHAGSSVTVTGVTGVTNSAGDHVHGIKHLTLLQTGGGGSTSPGAVEDSVGSPDSGSNFLMTAGAHTHTVSINDFSVNTAVQIAFTGVNILNAFTGITNDSATTGITTTDDSGTGAPHENLPPFYSCLFVIKL